ncbi:LON peptidase substrate-binding domain-containing protein [Gammaproteobacteria bacterium]|nr:LON peptidase substrate-binding domain-containing protein [Gammaproteobacteria bacterium]
MKENIPIFPLSTITFPGGYVPLRIFETRYIDMVKNCVKNNTGFGISLSKPNNVDFYDVGTYCKIADWEQMDDGLLGITARGKYRYRILNSRIEANNLITADIETMEEPKFSDIPKELMPYSDFLKNLLDQYPKFYHDDAPKYYSESGWVGSRLTEILPMSTQDKQVILETEDYLVRLYKIKDYIDSKKTV